MLIRQALAAMLVAGVSLAVRSPAAGQVKNPTKTLAIGDKAPDFKLPGVDGKDYTLASFADAKLLLVIFTCNHCPTAQAYEDADHPAARRLQGQGRGAGGHFAQRSAGRAAG